MSERVERFLAARGLDEAAGLAVECGELSDAEVARVRAALAGDEGSTALRNVLLHPEVIPHEMVVSALLSGLQADDRSIMLAAVVGSHRAAGTFTAADRHAVTASVLGLLPDAGSVLIRQRASAALVVLASREDTPALIGRLTDGEPVVRHNVRAALIRTLGAAGAMTAVSEAASAGAVPADALRFVADGVAGGAATVHDLIVRGVLTAQLAPIATLEG